MKTEINSDNQSISVCAGSKKVEIWLKDARLFGLDYEGGNPTVAEAVKYDVLLGYEGSLGIEDITAMTLSFFNFSRVETREEIVKRKDWDFQISFGKDGLITIMRKIPGQEQEVEFLSVPHSPCNESAESKNFEHLFGRRLASWVSYGKIWAGIPFGRKPSKTLTESLVELHAHK